MNGEVCKNCGVSIILVNYALGPKWMHNPLGNAGHKMGGAAYNVYEHCRVSVATPADPPPPKPECKGFQWVGQSFASCEGCGQPFWEHTYDTRMRSGAGPFDDDPFEYVLITDEQKAACKAKWGAR